MSTKTSELRSEAISLSSQFRFGDREGAVRDMLVTEREPEQLAFLAVSLADFLDPGQRAMLLTELREKVNQ